MIKAIFLRSTGIITAIVTHSEEGKEHELVGLQQEDIFVKDIPEDIMAVIDDPSLPYSHKNLKLQDGEVVLDTEEKTVTKIEVPENYNDTINFIKDAQNPLEERFNKLVTLLQLRLPL